MSRCSACSRARFTVADGRSPARSATPSGYSERQLHRWFETYRQDGLGALLSYETSRGSRERVTPEAWTALEAEMKAGHIGGLKQAQRYLADEHGILYSVGGLSALFQRRKTKLKTGRPRHVKASADEQEAWKKTVR